MKKGSLSKANGLHGSLPASSHRLSCPVHPRRPRTSRSLRLGVSAFDWFGSLSKNKQQPSSTATAPREEGSAALATPVAAPAPTAPAPKRDFLEARQVSLFQLFDSSEFVFDVPAYQRPYAWRTKQIYELLQDFVRAYESRQEYFLGAIVATRAAAGGPHGGATGDGTHTPYQLIDGQQRLTSLMLLLGYLRHWAAAPCSAAPSSAGAPAAGAGAVVVPGPGLEGRLRRMLYLEADPLDPASTGRYRLRLREPDDTFLRRHMLDAWLPTTFRRAGVMAAGADGSSSGSSSTSSEDGAAGVGAGEGWGGIGSLASGGPGSSGVQGGDGGEALPLVSESHWRLYENAAFLGSQLDRLAAAGLNLQDFAFHVLRNCFVVLMVARDEGASFTIFSCLNGRGMDLTVVDKLKAELLQSLSPAERTSYAAAWSDMEAVLGRPAFHRVFTYMRSLAAVRDPGLLTAAAVGGLAVGGGHGHGAGDDGSTDADGAAAGVLEYFTRRADDPAAVKQILQVALDYARLLLQLRQASWVPPPPPSQPLRQQPLLPLPAEAEAAHLAALHQQHTQWAAAATSASARGTADTTTNPYTASVAVVAVAIHPQDAAAHLQHQHQHQQALLLAELNAASAALNLFSDEAWLPPLLEFCYQTDDLAQRLQFMRAAEALQLLLELQGDAAAKAARWGVVAEALLARPFNPGEVLEAVALSGLERAAFRAFLDSKDLYGTAEQRTLRHLLLRCEPPSVWAQAPDIRGLHVEKVVPQSAPEGSMWRKTRISSPCDPQSAWPPAWFSSGSVTGGGSSQGGGGGNEVGGISRSTRELTTSSCTSSAATVPTASASTSTSAAAASTHTSYEVKYWYDVQRLHWHGKLGNLVLLPATAATTASSSASSPSAASTSAASASAAATAAGAAAGVAASPSSSYSSSSHTQQHPQPPACHPTDYDAKAAQWRAAGAGARLPGFTGPLLQPGAGRYSRFRFCYDECRQRHQDMLDRLATVFDL
ncbi:hypothetical protein HYH02_011660 [Chlamydomonas schloesseri]|uniref:GmrSD restriction endonucleases N-terminal domain-containing protein n=1 Tax=Chlamydomonas schloesseri TaxID=2026947 RepID=A0A835T2I0_9CHLO|nr:hypothetical protein HYH02_011660 [Chlamydomonas schloesseri]|eukprot:KAG2436156.1 hypothetical protein HYH02_011660 [Chlamydomonas schloesseri]